MQMLAEDISQAKANVGSQISDFDKLIRELEKNTQKNSYQIRNQVEKYERLFFNNLTMVLADLLGIANQYPIPCDISDPVLELYLLAKSLKSNNEKMDFGSFEVDPSKTILKYRSGMEIKMTRNQFEKLAEAVWQKVGEVG
jgi:hypothetical protein